jgi:hypothetical protein
MEQVIISRNPGTPHEDLFEVVVPISEFRRWFYGNSDVQLFEKKNNVQRSNGGFNAGVLYPIVAGWGNDEAHQRKVRAIKNYWLKGDPLPHDIYRETDEERIEREAIERENAKSPSTKRLERQMELDREESKLRSINNSIKQVEASIEASKREIERLKEQIPSVQESVDAAKRRFEDADAVVKQIEAFNSYQPVFESGQVVNDPPVKPAGFVSQSSNDVAEKLSRKRR